MPRDAAAAHDARVRTYVHIEAVQGVHVVPGARRARLLLRGELRAAGQGEGVEGGDTVRATNAGVLILIHPCCKSQI